MPETDRWSGHLEYLKVAVTLATATLAVAAAVYSDGDKIPRDNSKYALLASAGFVALALFASLLAFAALANRLALMGGAAPPDPAPGTGRITRTCGASFIFLGLAGFCLGVFFWMRTFSDEPVNAPLQAIEASQSLVTKKSKQPGELVTLSKFETAADKFNLTFKLTPGSKTVLVVFDPKTKSVVSLSEQP